MAVTIQGTRDIPIAELTQRRTFAMELDPAYCDLICERFEKYTGITAELVT